MPFDFVTEAWQDFDGNRWRGDPTVPETWGPKTKDEFGDTPPDLSTVQGTFVHLYDPETGEHHRFWVYTYMPFDIDQWIDQIAGVSAQHGMELA